MSDEKIIDLDTGRRTEDRAARHLNLVSKCQACFFEQLPHLVGELFDHTDDDMFELAGKAKCDIIETQYFSAMRELRKLREDIEHSFQTSLRNTFKDFWITHNVMSRDERNIELDAFALVEDDELEEQLAADALIAKAENRYGLELQGMSARFALLAGIKGLEVRENPLSPYHFVEAFRTAMRRWQGDISMRLVVFKIFDLHIINYIGGVYDSINEILIDEGVLPKLKRKIKKNPVSPNVRASMSDLSSAQSATDLIAGEFKVPAQATFDIMERTLAWLTQHYDYSPYSRALPSSERYEHLPTASNADVLDALTRLQQSILTAPPATITGIRDQNAEYLISFAELLRLGHGQEAEQRLEKRDEIIIDAVGMLFDFIVQERALPDSAKTLLSRLQFPLIKAAKLDFSFFGNKQHPARVLLNSLARAMTNWTDDGNRSKHSLFGQAEATIAFILQEFTDDITTFAIASERFATFHARHEARAQNAEKRLTQVMRGQEELLAARQRTAEVFHQMNLRAKKVSDVVIDIQREAWHDVLMLAYLREGEDSEAWNRHISTLKLLIWSVLPKKTAEDRQKLLKVIPSLLKKLKAGLNEIGYDFNKASMLFDRLKHCHHAILAGRHKALHTVSAHDDGMQSQADESGASPTDHQRCENLPEVGSWLQWSADGISYRGKLAWHSTVNGLCLFVNQNGTKLAEMNERELSELLRDGQAKVLPRPHRPFMDDILASMESLLSGKQGLTRKLA